MKAQFLILGILASVFGPAQAQSDVYLCMNGNGVREYKNTGDTKGCKKVDLPGSTMIPAPASAYRKPIAQTAARSVSTPTPADFPRVDGTTQKARDSERSQILLDELRNEEKKLALLRQEYNNGEPERRGDEKNHARYLERVAGMKEDLSRTEKNIEALKREISNLK